MVDCIVLAHQELSMEELGMFVAILWECWNARNRFIFESIEDDVTQVSSRARRFVASYREMKDTMGVSGQSHPAAWKPPPAGLLKLNFDSGQLGEQGWGNGFVVRGSDGAVVLAGVQQKQGTITLAGGEAQACLFALQSAQQYGISSLCVEGDCLPLIQKLQNKTVEDNFVGFIISNILALVVQFEFVAFSFVQREGNAVAHDLAHWLSVVWGSRFWCENVPDEIVTHASGDMFTYIDSHLI